MLTYDEYMKQSKDYCEALEKIKVELSNKRSEMANLAMQTVKDFETKIPALQAKINTLNGEVSRLDKLIAVKSKQADADEEYWKKHYLTLEVELNKAHDARTAMFKYKDDQYDLRDKAHAQSIVEMTNREQSLVVSKENHISELESHNKLVEQFENDKEFHEKLVGEIMDNVNKHLQDAQAEKNKQVAITKKLEEQSTALAKATQEAKYVIARINEAQEKLDAAQLLVDRAYIQEDKNKKDIETLNEFHSRNIAEIQRILNDQDALSARERLLFQRENNVKVAEASLRKG